MLGERKNRVLYRRGEAGIPPPPTNLEIDYGLYCGAIKLRSYLILHVKYVSSECCLENLSQIVVSEAI